MISRGPNTYTHPDDAIRDLADRIVHVGVDASRTNCNGRVLAQLVTADRDSPAADVSAMDGYAIRMDDLSRNDEISISGESAPGAPPPAMQPNAVVRVFTGAIVPPGCDAVVKREDTDELDDAIRLLESARSTSRGQHIRCAGENAKSGSTVLSAGTLIASAQRATMANFGCFEVDLYSPVRVSIITTGDEVGLFADDQPRPWQIRNSNRVSLTSLLELIPWITIEHVDHCKDDQESLTQLLTKRIKEADAIIMTGGVSMGDYDYVPDVVREIGGEVVFHGLPIRPGKPILGAATGDGKLLMGLPGNPVSATIGCKRMVIPLLAKASGQSQWRSQCPVVRLDDAGEKTIPLHWMRLVRLIDHGVAVPVLSQGSGDLVSMGQSTGFVELPPGASGEGPWPYHSWT